MRVGLKKKKKGWKNENKRKSTRLQKAGVISLGGKVGRTERGGWGFQEMAVTLYTSQPDDTRHELVARKYFINLDCDLSGLFSQ